MAPPKLPAIHGRQIRTDAAWVFSVMIGHLQSSSSYTHLYIYIYIHVCTYICMYVCIYIYITLHTSPSTLLEEACFCSFARDPPLSLSLALARSLARSACFARGQVGHGEVGVHAAHRGATPTDRGGPWHEEWFPPHLSAHLATRGSGG